jgi:hypothetical protein
MWQHLLVASMFGGTVPLQRGWLGIQQVMVGWQGAVSRWYHAFGLCLGFDVLWTIEEAQ